MITAADKKIILAAVLLVFISSVFVFNRRFTAQNRILVWKNGKVTMELPLSGQGFFLPEQGVSLEIMGGRARITANDCPGKDCLKKGWISSPGDFIICAPKRIVIGFSDENSGAYKQKIKGADSITY